jgi:hypothetical protein
MVARNFKVTWSILGGLLALVMLSGCAQRWAKLNGTEAEFNATNAGCSSKAYSQFPPAPRQVMLLAGYTTPIQTNCYTVGYSVQCTTTGGQYIPPTYINVDDNETPRGNAVTSCLYTAGWRPAKDKEEAARITRYGF